MNTNNNLQQLHRYLRRMLGMTLLVAASAASAQVNIGTPWVFATVAQQKATAAFMQLSATQDMRLVAVSSPVAGVVELHRMGMVDDVMRMRAVPNIELPASKLVELKPGGYHVMLLELKEQIKVGQHVPLTLVVEDRQNRRSTLHITATAQPLNSALTPAAHHH